MQRHFLYCAASISVCMWCLACQPKVSPTSNALQSNSRDALDWAGVYKGTLPCPDCTHITASLTLRADNTYQLEEMYHGKDLEATVRTGSFRWDTEGRVVTLLTTQKVATPYRFAVGEGRLLWLEKDAPPNWAIANQNNTLYVDDTRLLERYWKLIELNGRPVTSKVEVEREPHIVFKAVSERAQGHSGCNRFSGTYELGPGNRLRLTDVAATKMACLHPNDIENELFQCLKKMDNYSIVSDTLLLSQGRGMPIARLVAVATR